MADGVVLLGAFIGALTLLIIFFVGVTMLARTVLEGAYMLHHRWMTLADLREAVTEWRANHPDKWKAYQRRSDREEGND